MVPDMWGRETILNKMVREDHTKKTAFEQNPREQRDQAMDRESDAWQG